MSESYALTILSGVMADGSLIYGRNFIKLWGSLGVFFLTV